MEPHEIIAKMIRGVLDNDADYPTPDLKIGAIWALCTDRFTGLEFERLGNAVLLRKRGVKQVHSTRAHEQEDADDR